MKRRDFVKLAAAGMTLPWLSTLGHAKAYDGNVPKRIFIFIDPYGRYGTQNSSSETDRAPWMPSDSGDFPLRSQNIGWMLDPLSSHLDNLSVFSGIHMRSRQALGGGITHAQIDSYALTGSRVSGDINSTATFCAHPSLNNVIGDLLNGSALRKNAYNSLAIGSASKYNYGSDGIRAGQLANPEVIYNTAFGVSDSHGLLSQQAVISQVRKQIGIIAPELVQANSATVIDAYRHSVDAIAAELESRASLDLENIKPDNVVDTIKTQLGMSQMFDATYDLFACGLTPSVLYGYDGWRHGWLRDDNLLSPEANEHLNMWNYHWLSHENHEVAGAAQAMIMKGQIASIADLADRLQATPELDGSGDSMMDNTVIFYTQSMSRNTHGSTTPYYQFLLAGANTNLKRGWHFDCSSHSDNELLATVAQALGLPITSFGGYQYDQLKAPNVGLKTGPIDKALLQTYGS